MRKLMEKCVAALGARDWRINAAAAVLIASGLVLLLRHHGFGTTAPAPGLVEARVVARTAVRSAEMSPSDSNAASAVVQRAPAVGQQPAASDTARALQSGLRRAGCYEGPVDGQWSRQSREAMARFVSGVNAQLPVERPEGVLLALLEANTNHTCASQRASAGTAVAATPTPPSPPVTSPPAAAAPRGTPAAPPAPPPVHSAEVKPQTPPTQPAPAATDVTRDVPRFTPFALAAAVPPLPVPAPPPSAPAASGDRAGPRTGRTNRSASRVYMAPRKYIVRHHSRSPADKFARSVTRNVRSLQRSLGMIVHY